MPYYAGLDRSGTPERKNRAEKEIYCVAFIVVECDMSLVRQAVLDARTLCGLPASAEFRGHDLPEKHHQILLQACEVFPMRVAARLYDKSRDIFENPPSDFQETAALDLFGLVVARWELKQLWCDEDVKGPRQKPFETELRRLHRMQHPTSRFAVRHRASKTSDLIQLADIVAYDLSRFERGAIENQSLAWRIREMIEDSRNVIIGHGDDT